MSWFNRVRNSLPFVAKRSTDETLWIKCKGCGEMIFASDYADNLYVCPRCEHHGRIGADTRIAMLMDEGFALLPQPEVKEAPLKFRDSKRYVDRLKEYKAKADMDDAVLAARRPALARPGAPRVPLASVRERCSWYVYSGSWGGDDGGTFDGGGGVQC